MPVYSAGEARLTIVPDAREFRAKLEADLRKIRADYAVQVSADTARARADVIKFRTEQETAKAIRINAEVDLTRAKLELAEFRAEQKAIAIKLRAELDRANLRKSFEGIKSDFANLGSELGNALKIDAATVGIELLPALAAGLVSVAQALEQVADAGLAVPGILAGVGASVGTLALGLGGVKDAWSAVTKAADTSASGQARSAEQVTSATNALRNAVVDEAKAQKDVADARKEARQQLEDLNIEIRGGALSEKEAILEAAKARRDLATGRYKDALDYQSAQLRVEEADQRVVESRQHNIELHQKVSDANAKGIEGSDRVVEANERLVRSHQSVQAAAEALSTVGSGGAADKAAEALAKLAPNAREFVQAMISLKPAFKDLRDSDAQNLFAGMGGALKTLVASDLPLLKSGIGNIATSINQDLKQLFGSLGSDSTKGLIDRILGNTANADARVKAAIDPLVHAFATLTASSSNSLPRLADAFDHVADRFDKFISAAAADGRLDKWINDGLTAFTHLGETFLHLGETFHGLSTALGGQGLLADLDKVTGKMAAFVNSADGQKKLTKFFQEGRDEFHKWEPIIENLAKMLPPMFAAAKDSADAFLPVIKDITGFLVKHPDLVRDATAAYLLWETTLKPIGAVAGAIKDVSKFVRLLITDINGVGTAAEVNAVKVEATAAREVTAEEAVEAEMNRVVAAQAYTPGGAPLPGGKPAKQGTNWGGLGAAILAPIAIAQAINPDTIPVLTNLLQGQDKDGTPLRDKYQSPVPPAPPPDKDPTGGQGLGGLASIPSSQGGLGAPPPPAAPTPPPGLDHADQWKSLADKGDPMAKWVLEGKDPADQGKRAEWLKAHQDQIKGATTFTAPPSYEVGGPTPSGRGPGPTGGFPIEVHGDEYVISAKGRAAQPDSFWHAANQGKLPGFDDGGPVDLHQDPRDAAPNPATLGPQPIAPNPTGAGDGILNNLVGGIASGVQGPIGNVIGLIQQGATAAQAGGGGGGAGGGASIPGIWGLLQAGGNPDAMNAWAGQTANWLGNFGAKTAASAGQIGLQGVLGGLGLSGLSSYGAPLQQTAGFYLGQNGPLSALMGGGGGGADLSGGGIGSQTINVGDGSSIQIPTFGTAGGGTSGGGLNWDALAAKEASGNWQTNTGNGYYGGLQFDQSTWNAYKPAGAPDNPAAASREQQIQAGANAIAARGGPQSLWPQNYGQLGASAGAHGPAGAIQLVPQQWGGVDAIAASFGLTAGSRFRDPNGPTIAGVPANRSYHASGRATDYNGTPEQRLAFAQFMAANYGPQLKELIYSAPGFNSTINNGQVVGPFGAFYTLAQAGDHSDHVHIAFAKGGAVPSASVMSAGLYDEGGAFPTGTVAFNNSGKPEAVLTNEQHQALQTVAQHLTTQTQPSQPQGPDAQHLQTPQPAPSGPIQPPSTPATPIPSPGGAAADVPASTPSGGHISPSLAAPSVAPPPSSLDHNLKAIDTGIDSGAQAIGQAVSTAIGIAGGAAGGFGGGAISAIGPYVSGLIQEGGKVTKDVVNIASSFLVGDVTGGTQDLAYGAPLRPAQNTPNVAPGAVTNWNISGNYELRSAMDQAELKHAQDTQTAFAGHGRITP